MQVLLGNKIEVSEDHCLPIVVRITSADGQTLAVHLMPDQVDKLADTLLKEAGRIRREMATVDGVR